MTATMSCKFSPPFREFLDGYTELLRRQYGTKRVQANVVYQEYIHDRDHVHMNSTQWETLTDFVKWLGREGMLDGSKWQKATCPCYLKILNLDKYNCL